MQKVLDLLAGTKPGRQDRWQIALLSLVRQCHTPLSGLGPGWHIDCDRAGIRNTSSTTIYTNILTSTDLSGTSYQLREHVQMYKQASTLLGPKPKTGKISLHSLAMLHTSEMEVGGGGGG